MGCATSKLDASDVILQCKKRRKAMKHAVNCRQDFAIAHVAYIQTLKNVGLALRRFSEGEVSDTSPKSPSTPVLRLQETSHADMPMAALSPPRSPSRSSSSTPIPSFSSPAVARSTAAGISPSAPPKLASPAPPSVAPASASPPPSSRASHLSQSSPPPLTQASSPRRSVPESGRPSYSVNGMGSPKGADDYSPTYSPRPDDVDDYFVPFSSSQPLIHSSPRIESPPRYTSSWFNYDIFDPPPIPYNLREQRRKGQVGDLDYGYDDGEAASPTPPPITESVRREESMPDLEEEDLKQEEGELIKNERKSKAGGEEVPSLAPVIEPPKAIVADSPLITARETATEVTAEKSHVDVIEAVVNEPDPEKIPALNVEPKEISSPKELTIVPTTGGDFGGVVRHIHTHFGRAWRSGKDVSNMLETRMVHHHLDNSKVFNAITMHWSRKSSLAMRDAYEDDEAPQCGMFGSHASTLERIYAWEKKLYDEVKEGEILRISFDRKCQQLHNLDAKGGDTVAIDQTRAALKKLDTRLIVALRAIHLASTRIQKLTNEELFPQLAELLGGLMSMWNVMWECHKAQAAIAAEMQTIENSLAANEASEVHIKATSQLEHELENWQTHFQRWISAQKSYIQALHVWLSNCHMEPERDSKGRAVSPHWSAKPAIFHLLTNWMNAILKLEESQRVVDTISDFSVVLSSLEIEQAGELELRKNAEKSARDLDRSNRSLKRLESRYIEYKGEANGSTGNGLSRGSDLESRRADVDSRRSNVEREKQRHMEVMLDRKEKTLSRFREHLPLVFESMASFAKEAVNIYERLLPEKSYEGEWDG